MNSCQEFVLDDLMAVTAIPVADFDPGFRSWQMSPVIDATDFPPLASDDAPELANAIVIGLRAAADGGLLVPITSGSGKAKDNEGDSVSGRFHTVTVSCEADDRDPETWDTLLLLERTPCHLLLTFRGGQRAFVQATPDTYRCTVERSGADTDVSFKIQCRIGLQMLYNT